MKTKDNKNHEAMILLPIVLLVLFLFIGIGIVNNKQEQNNAQLQGVEGGLEQVKREMSRRYDDELVNALEVASIEKIRERGQDLYLKVTLSIPNIEDVLLNYYEIAIREDFWDEEDLDFHIQRAFQQAVDQSQTIEFSLPEEIRLRKRDQGDWQVSNPEDMNVQLPARIKNSLRSEVQWTRDRFYTSAVQRLFFIAGEDENFKDFYALVDKALYENLTYRSEVVEKNGVREIQFQAVERDMKKMLRGFQEEAERRLGESVYGVKDLLEIVTETLYNVLEETEVVYHPLNKRVITFEKEPPVFSIEESRMIIQERELILQEDKIDIQTLWDSAQSIGFRYGEIWNQEIMEIEFRGVDRVYRWEELGDYGVLVYLDGQQRKIALLDLVQGLWLDDHELGIMDQEYLDYPYHHYHERNLHFEGNIGALNYPINGGNGGDLINDERETFVFEIVDGSIKEIMKRQEANMALQEIILYEEEVYLRQILREEANNIHQIIKPRTGEIIFELSDVIDEDHLQEEADYSPWYQSQTVENGRYVLYYMDHTLGLQNHYSKLYFHSYNTTSDDKTKNDEVFKTYENQMYLFDLKKEEVVLGAEELGLEDMDTNRTMPIGEDQIMIFSKHHGWWLLDGERREIYPQEKGKFEIFSEGTSKRLSFDSETSNETAAHLTRGEVLKEDLLYLRSSRFFDHGMEGSSFWYLKDRQVQPLLGISKHVNSELEHYEGFQSNWDIEYDKVLNKLIVTDDNQMKEIEEVWMYSIDQEIYQSNPSLQVIEDIRDLNTVPWLHLQSHIEIDRKKQDFTMGTFLTGRNYDGIPLKDFRDKGFGLLKEGSSYREFEPAKHLMYIEELSGEESKRDLFAVVRVNRFIDLIMDHEKEHISILTKDGYYVYDQQDFLQILRDLL